MTGSSDTTCPELDLHGLTGSPQDGEEVMGMQSHQIVIWLLTVFGLLG